MRILLVLGAAHLAFAAVASGQASAPDGSRLALGTDSLVIYLVRDDARQRVGRLWDELQRVDVAGRPALRRVYRTENALFGPNLDTVVSRLPDLKPISLWTSGHQASYEARFREDSIVGRRAIGGGSVQPIARVADKTLYDAGTFDLIVRAAPLAEGWSIELPAYLATQDSVVQLRARVTGSETLRRAAARKPPVDVWVVDMDFAGLSSTMWIEKQSRALVRQVIRLRPGISMLMEADDLDQPS